MSRRHLIFTAAAALLYPLGRPSQSRPTAQQADSSPLTSPNPWAPEYRPEEWSPEALAKLEVPRGVSITTQPHDGRWIPDPNCYGYATQAPLVSMMGDSLGLYDDVLPREDSSVSSNLLGLTKTIRRHSVGARIDGLRPIGRDPIREANHYLTA